MPLPTHFKSLDQASESRYATFAGPYNREPGSAKDPDNRIAETIVTNEGHLVACRAPWNPYCFDAEKYLGQILRGTQEIPLQTLICRAQSLLYWEPNEKGYIDTTSARPQRIDLNEMPWRANIFYFSGKLPGRDVSLTAGILITDNPSNPLDLVIVSPPFAGGRFVFDPRRIATYAKRVKGVDSFIIRPSIKSSLPTDRINELRP